MSLTMDYLQALSKEWTNDFWVAHKDPNGIWSKWLPLSQWSKFTPVNYRQVLPNEVVMESDFDDKTNKLIAEEICKKLRDNNIAYERYFSGNKSHHIHCFFVGLDTAPIQVSAKTKELLVDSLIGSELSSKLDKSLFGPKHLVLIPNENHPKTDVRKMLVDSYHQGSVNPLPEIVKDFISLHKQMVPQVIITPQEKIKCSAMELSIKKRFPDGSGRQNRLAPNFSAFSRTRSDRQQLRNAFYATQVDTKPNCLSCWDSKKSTFSCKQLRNYMYSIGEGSTCDLCMLNKGDKI
ncbi:MAG: hypothetical protein NTY48_04530 [Candidatus Diapherotrites archaeon]|nr:hypothetical protein [Candidatus Diapherotrites archaeon]